MSDVDWYLLDRGGRRYGPYDREQVEQLASRNELQASTPVWHPGLARWQPAERVLSVHTPMRNEVTAAAVEAPVPRPPQVRTAPARPAVSRPAAARTARTPARSVTRSGARPAAAVPAALKIAATPMTSAQATRRVIAVVFDLLCLLLVSALFAAASTDGELSRASLRPAPLFFIAWAALDAASTVRNGSTPGKALMGIRIHGPDGAPLAWPRAMLRSGALPVLLLLLVLRTGFTIFIAAAALFLTARRVQAGFAPWWDDVAGARVTYGELAPSRGALAVVAFVVVLIALGAILQG